LRSACWRPLRPSNLAGMTQYPLQHHHPQFPTVIPRLVRGTSARPSTGKHRSPGCPLRGHRGMTVGLGVAKSVPAPASPFTPCRECAASAPTPSPQFPTVIPRSRHSRDPGDLSQAVDGEAQVPRMPALRSPWDDGGVGCFEERAGARFALHPLPGVRRVRSNTITPIPHRHPPACPGDLSQAVDGEAQVPRMPAARSPWDDGGVGGGGNKKAPASPPGLFSSGLSRSPSPGTCPHSGVAGVFPSRGGGRRRRR
jgi:hypothetical protein